MEHARRSPLAVTLDRIGDRWSLLIVEALLAGPQRFSDLSRLVPGIAPNILVERLRSLERAAVVVAEPYSERPLRLSYRLTQEGHDLGGAIRLLAAWGAPNSDATPLPRHVACGTPLEPRWFCPTCARPSEDEDEAALVEV